MYDVYNACYVHGKHFSALLIPMPVILWCLPFDKRLAAFSFLENSENPISNARHGEKRTELIICLLCQVAFCTANKKVAMY